MVYDDDATYMAEIDWGKFSQNVCDLMQVPFENQTSGYGICMHSSRLEISTT